MTVLTSLLYRSPCLHVFPVPFSFWSGTLPLEVLSEEMYDISQRGRIEHALWKNVIWM
jgi:hypothetical protein